MGYSIIVSLENVAVEKNWLMFKIRIDMLYFECTVNMTGETLVPNKIFPGFMLGKSSLYAGKILV